MSCHAQSNLVLNLEVTTLAIHSNDPVPFVNCHVRGSDNSYQKFRTDSIGHYRSIKGSLELNSGFVYSISVNHNGQYILTDTIDLSNISESTTFVKEYSFRPAWIYEEWRWAEFRNDSLGGYWVGDPYVFFADNSVEMERGQPDAIENLTNLFLDNPPVVVELVGSCADPEQDQYEGECTLAIQRCQFVRDLLIQRGIHPDRIVCSEPSVDEPIPSWFNPGTDPTELETAKRRVSFYRIIGYDFEKD